MPCAGGRSRRGGRARIATLYGTFQRCMRPMRTGRARQRLSLGRAQTPRGVLYGLERGALKPNPSSETLRLTNTDRGRILPCRLLTRRPSLRVGAPDRSRTCDLWLRKPTLYPTELRAHGRRFYRAIRNNVHPMVSARIHPASNAAGRWPHGNALNLQRSARCARRAIDSQRSLLGFSARGPARYTLSFVRWPTRTAAPPKTSGHCARKLR